METGEAALHQALRAHETGFQAILPPIGDVGFRQHGHYLDAGDRMEEKFYGTAKDRNPFQLQELLGKDGPHAGSATPCCNHYVFFSFHPGTSLREYKNFFVFLEIDTIILI